MELIRENLDGKHVCLELPVEEHREPLRAVVADPDIWHHIQGPNLDYDKWFDGILHNKNDIVFIIRDKASNTLVGSTRYMSIFPEHNRLEIGYTWCSPKFWGGVVNPNCKLLLLTHAFEVMGAGRVELKTHLNNKRSQAAIKKLGAEYEGTFRDHMINPDGTMRDTVMFALLKRNWPQAKAKLLARI
ncbi:MAG: GNAT family N-acetyltransferase [Sphingomonadales bacterium]|nr:GNAT family N-acetyltransferase [Sphingomonadales bacterium]